MIRSAALGLSLIALTACSKRAGDAAPTPAKAEPARAAPGPAAVSLDSLPVLKAATARSTQSGARFEKTTLAECVDVEALVEPPANAPPDWKPKGSVADAFFASTKGVTKIAKTCGEQFSDRSALASCTYHRTLHEGDAGVAITFNAVAYFFDIAELGDDHHMKDCLDAKADWQAVSKDSLVWKKAKLAQSRKRLEKIVDQAAAAED